MQMAKIQCVIDSYTHAYLRLFHVKSSRKDIDAQVYVSCLALSVRLHRRDAEGAEMFIYQDLRIWVWLNPSP